MSVIRRVTRNCMLYQFINDTNHLKERRNLIATFVTEDFLETDHE